MFKRLLPAIFTAMLLVPAFALADDAPAPIDPSTAATSSGLGPQSSADGAGSSNADSAALQPAGQAPLQSTTADSVGLGAPSNALQAPAASSDNLQVLSGEADGPAHQTAGDPTPPWNWLAAGFVVALIVAGAVMIARDRRRFAGPQL